jgi:drug/metabolite transporter (DMT)-like permease
MHAAPDTRDYMSSAALLMLAGWGGLVLLIFVFQLPPLVWARWGFFALWFTALSGTALPIAYFLNLRFPSVPPAEPAAIVRQALWVGVYGSVIAWLQLGHVMAFWMWIGLAAGLIAVEYLIRLRERAVWTPPAHNGGSHSEQRILDSDLDASALHSDE